MPVLTLPRLLLSLVSLALVALGAYWLWSWAHGYDVRDADGVWRHVRGPAWRLYAGGGLLAWSALGRFLVLALMRDGDDPPAHDAARRMLRSKDGAEIAVEVSGRADGPALVLAHGWGLDCSSWAWLGAHLGQRFKLVAFDQPGLGHSSQPSDHKLSLERLADALAEVLAATAERPVVLIGHSIGGMAVQTLFRTHPELAKEKVAGVVLLNTTYENPLRTMWLTRLWRALQKPVLEPMSWLTVALAPLVWLSNWQSYLSGSAQLAIRLAGFGRYATRRQVDHVALLSARNNPAVQAKGNLAMFHWSVGEALKAIDCPALVVAGSKDIVTMPIAGEVIASRIWGARMATVEGAGHMGPMEAASAYAGEIARFAEDALRTSRPAAADGLDSGSPAPRAEERPPLH